MTQQPEMRPCPFCGGEPYDAHLAGSAWFIGAHHKDGCHFDDFQRSEAEAIAAWNTRAAPQPEPVGDLREKVARLAMAASRGYADTYERGRMSSTGPFDFSHDLEGLIAALKSLETDGD